MEACWSHLGSILETSAGILRQIKKVSTKLAPSLQAGSGGRVGSVEYEGNPQYSGYVHWMDLTRPGTLLKTGGGGSNCPSGHPPPCQGCLRGDVSMSHSTTCTITFITTLDVMILGGASVVSSNAAISGCEKGG